MPIIPSIRSSLARITVDTLLAAHGALAMVYWFVAPHGFPFDHGRFWLNTACPILIAATSAILIVLHHRLPLYTGMTVLSVVAAWGTSALVANWVFPYTFRHAWIPGLIVSAIAVAVAVQVCRRAPLPLRLYPPLLMPTLIAVFCIWANKAPAPSTPPLNMVGPNVDGTPARDDIAPITIGAAKYFPSQAALIAQNDEIYLTCDPLLTFDRISPDGCWSILSAIQDKLRGRPTFPPNRTLIARDRHDDRLLFRYSDQSVIILPTEDAANRIELTAYSTLNADTFTHLNSFCVFTINGHARLSLAFSPCPSDEIAVLASDYPVGRPVRFAYRNSQDEFRVVEASSGEKGPFQTLASGALKRGDPLSILVYDDHRQVARVTLDDWSAQASTELSPTAGWGVPMNAIEFFRNGERETDSVSIYITLAGTSVGRGWDCVGHRAGTYRNRLQIEVSSPQP